MSAMVLILFFIAVFTGPPYLICAHVLGSRIRADFPQAWESLGRPAFMGSGNQRPLLEILTGTMALPVEAKALLGSLLLTARILGLVSFLSIVGLFVLTI